MGAGGMRLAVEPDRLGICRFGAGAPVPLWAFTGVFSAVIRTRDELSVVCEETIIPAGSRCERGWRAIKVQGPLPFTATGVLASLAVPLGKAGISIFVLSTFDTDYILVKEEGLAAAVEVLGAAGHTIA